MTFFTGCVNPVKKQAVGIWKVEEIRLSGDTARYDQDQIKTILEEHKKIWFEIVEDSIITVYTGSMSLSGKWWVKRHSPEVFVILGGGTEASSLGAYEEGKLVNKDTSEGGITITTIFAKELPGPEAQDQ